MAVVETPHVISDDFTAFVVVVVHADLEEKAGGGGEGVGVKSEE